MAPSRQSRAAGETLTAPGRQSRAAGEATWPQADKTELQGRRELVLACKTEPQKAAQSHSTTSSFKSQAHAHHAEQGTAADAQQVLTCHATGGLVLPQGSTGAPESQAHAHHGEQGTR